MQTGQPRRAEAKTSVAASTQLSFSVALTATVAPRLARDGLSAGLVSSVTPRAVTIVYFTLRWTSTDSTRAIETNPVLSECRVTLQSRSRCWIA